jgi:CheY-specific phosphatase CheX
MPETLVPPSVVTFPPVICAAVCDATMEFFGSSCGLKHQELTEFGEDSTVRGVLSTISFFGEPSWAFTLAFPAEAAVKAAKAFAGFDIPLDSADMGDVLGEIINVIAGSICAKLDAKGIKAQMSLPNVTRGDHLTVIVPSGSTTTRMAFSGSSGTFWIQLVKARLAAPVTARRPGT